MRRSIAALCSLALLAAAPAAADAAHAAHAAGTVRVAIDSAPDFSNMAAAQRDNVVILQSWQTQKLHALKAANPAVKVLMYKNSSAASLDTHSANLSSGVGKAQAEAHGWLLRNKAGRTFTYRGLSFLWAADIGARGYQDAWAANVIQQLKADRWDGVFMDDVNPTLQYHYDESQVAKYPTNAAYSTATKSFLAEVGPKIKAAGQLAIPNMGSWSDYAGVVDAWLPYVSGGMDEMFTKWGDQPGTGYRDPSGWKRQLDEVKATAAHGKLFLGISHSTAGDRAAARYGYGTMLLGGNGNATFSLAADYTHQTWFPEYDLNLGAPLGPEHANASGVHLRSFTKGLVIVNPSGDRHVVSYGGTYSRPGHPLSTGAKIGPHAAILLTRADNGVAANSAAAVARRALAAKSARAVARRTLAARRFRALPRLRLARGRVVRVRVTCAHGRKCRARLRLSTTFRAGSGRASIAALRSVSTRAVVIRHHSRVVTFHLRRGVRAGRRMTIRGARGTVRVSPRRFVLAR